MLNDDQKKFILENCKHTSARKLARQLNVSRSAVEAFIRETKKTPSIPDLSQYKKALLPLLLLVLLIFHLSLRYNAFWLSHFRGDQVHYIGLAMKLERFGIDGYSLRGIDYLTKQNDDGEAQLAKVIPSKDKEGMIMRSLKESGVGYYDIPFFHKGPAFPIALMLSHRIFGSEKDYILVVEHLGKKVFTTKPKEFFSVQFYAAVVPIFFSAMLMFLTFCLGKILFSDRIGVYAAFMLAANPIAVLTSYKLWADDMLAVFVVLSVILFVISQRRQKAWISFLAGVSCGIAVLAKQNGGVIFGAIIAYSIWTRRVLLKDIKKWPLLIFNGYLISYALGLAVLSAPWFYKIYSVYGDPLYRPVTPDIAQTDVTGWFKMLKARPHPLKLFAIGIPYMSPAFVFVYGTLKDLISTLLKPFKKMNNKDKEIVLLWLCIIAFVSFFVIFGGGREHRRMLPVYPAIAVLAAYMLNRLRIFVEGMFGNQMIAEILIIAILIFSAAWSEPIGMSPILDNIAVILRPF